jgi:hypothetical protein
MQVIIRPIPGVSVEYTYSKLEAAEAAAVAAYNLTLSVLSVVEAFFNVSIEAGRSARQSFDQAVGSSKTAVTETMQAVDYVIHANLIKTKIQHINVRECLQTRITRAAGVRYNTISRTLNQAVVRTQQALEPITLFLTTTD